MFQINKPIIAAVRLEESATEVLGQAVAMARHHQVKLYVCHVLPDLLSVRPLFPQFQLDNALRLSEFEVAAREALYSRVAAFINPDGDDCELLLEYGTAHSAILRAAERIDAGLIIVGHGSKGQTLSGVPERVVRYAHCAVLVARAAVGGCVLAATDFSNPATPAVEAAASEAKRLERDFVIIHSIDTVRFILSPDAAMPGLPPVDLLDAVAKASRERLDSCVAQFAAQDSILAHGPAEAAILEATKSLPADLVVVGNHGRTGLSRLALGSVAEAVMREAGCSTLVVRLHS